MKLKSTRFFSALLRPVVIITTVSEKGEVNGAPFSFNMPLSFEPPLYGFSCDPEHDTWMNIRETGEFTVNVAGRLLGEYLWILEKDYPRGVNELREANLTEIPSRKVRPPRVEEAIAWIECSLHSSYEIGDHVLIVGEVLEAEIKDEFSENGKIKPEEALLHISGKFFAQDARLVEYRRSR
ncbi:MAG: flavin reductase family protein [Archaeoglobi archaeon]|nr:flavin reductase family protein [Candidatus Mnemosynella bozhongmuii]